MPSANGGLSEPSTARRPRGCYCLPWMWNFQVSLQTPHDAVQHLFGCELLQQNLPRVGLEDGRIGVIQPLPGQLECAVVAVPGWSDPFQAVSVAVAPKCNVADVAVGFSGRRVAAVLLGGLVTSLTASCRGEVLEVDQRPLPRLFPWPEPPPPPMKARPA